MSTSTSFTILAIVIIIVGVGLWEYVHSPHRTTVGLVTVTDPNGKTCTVEADAKGRKPLAAFLGCPKPWTE